jgi:hypothetical protein
VGGVAVPVVDVVGVVPVRDGHMTAVSAVHVVVPVVHGVLAGRALVEVVVVLTVQVPVVAVVDMVPVRYRHVPAAVPVRMGVTGVRTVLGGSGH